MLQPTLDVTAERTPWHLLEYWVARQPADDFLVYLEDQERPDVVRRLTWERAAALALDLRRRLAALGVADQRAAVLALPNSPLAVICWLAIAANGAMIQAVDSDAGVLPLAEALRATRPVVAIAGRANAAAMARAAAEAGTGTRVLVADDLTLDRGLDGIAGLEPCVAAAPPAEAGSIAGLLPTSGTSGAPKLVAITNRSFVMAGERLARNSAHGRQDRFLICSPLFHVNAQLYGYMPALVTGGSLAVVPRFSASRYFDTARHLGATVSSMVAPPMRMALHGAVERGGVSPGSLRLIQYGMSMSAADWEAWDRLFPSIAMRQVYGQTETVSAALGGAPWEADDRRTIGRPFLGVDGVRLVGEDGGSVPDGIPGELLVRGRPGWTVMQGYYGNPAATAATLDADGWLRTGDLMVRDAEGRFAFVGRRMHLVRRGGENLSVYQLELMLQGCPLVVDVSIKAEPDPVLDAKIVAHVIPAPTFDEAAFLRWCREFVGRRGVPDAVRLHTTFPRTGSGRVISRDLG